MTDTLQWRALTVCGLATVAIACGPDPQPAASETPPIEPAQEARVAPAADAPDPTIAAALDAIRDRQQCNRVMGCKPATQLLQKGEEAVSPILEAVSRSRSDGYWRVRLVELLGQLRDARAAPVLEQLLRSNLWEIRCRAAIALGRADRALSVALEWAADREQFGQKIGKFQAVSFKLADMQTKLVEAELMTYRAAWLMDQDRMTDGDAAMAKISATEMLQFVSDEAIQVLGGMGLMDELPLERIWRDARVDRIWDGTSEIQRHIVSRQLLRPLGA